MELAAALAILGIISGTGKGIYENEIARRQEKHRKRQLRESQNQANRNLAQGREDAALRSRMLAESQIGRAHV